MPHATTIRTTIDGSGRVPSSVARHIRSVLGLYREREVEIVIRRPKRSTKANAYYHGVIVREVQRVFVEAGYAMTHDDCHEWIKARFLPMVPYDTPTGPAVRMGSTAEMDATAFFELVETIRTDELLLSLGFHVEDPEPSYRSYAIAA